MLTRFDHAVIGVRSLDAAIATWRGVLGFDPQPGGRHTGRGTYNALVRFGLDYIELISIYERGEIDVWGEANVRALTSLIDRAEGGMLGFALVSDDIEADARRLRRAGLAVSAPFPMERLRPDGRLLRWRLLVPLEGSWGKPLPTMIQWDDPDEQRLTWEQPGRHANGAASIAALAIVVRELDPWVEVYAERLGLPLTARDQVRELNADRARFRVGETRLDLLAPSGPGPIADAAGEGEQPWQLTLVVRNLEAASRTLVQHGIETIRAPGTAEGLLIPPEAALGARIVLLEGTPA